VQNNLFALPGCLHIQQNPVNHENFPSFINYYFNKLAMLSKRISKHFLLTPLSSAVLASIFMQPVAAYEFDKPIENAFKLGQDDAK
jgi:hypothetical protein